MQLLRQFIQQVTITPGLISIKPTFRQNIIFSTRNISLGVSEDISNCSGQCIRAQLVHITPQPAFSSHSLMYITRDFQMQKKEQLTDH